MSDPNEIFFYCMIGLIVVVAILREVAASRYPASHWLNQFLDRDKRDGDGGFWDCDGDGGD
ncbi:hypothetical protein KUV51_16980 [Tateyamaria omphalii]|uniref:hypothetical protein n=1 Tax=Tateyamaria omphalii TaxID=299262 RepID=UPI001C9A197A|nr:hypothetical protein [Tateyamaria omphalii]MBY5934704.1 hypothetical protein [Tateyamaria omphalii]